MATNVISLDVAQAELEKAEAELRRQQQEVDQLRAFVHGYEAMLRRMGIEQTSAAPESAKKADDVPPPAPPPAAPTSAPRPSTPGKGLTVEQMAIRELEKAGTFLGTRDLAERMAANGYRPKGNGKLPETVYATLIHPSKRPGNRLIKVGATWGLREWNPQQD
jgi:HB1/ASXL restriction endonuclease-like protein with HTH domain